MDSTQDLQELYYFPNEEKPVVNKKHYRHYGHNICPFAEKARLAFALKEIPYQHVTMDLEKKADWHQSFNGGLVPIVENPEG